MKRTLFWLFPAIIVVAVGVLVFFNLMLKPLLGAIAEARVRLVVTEALNQAILENLNADITYDKLMTVIQDKDGRVSMIQANSPLMNRLAATTAIAAQKHLSSIDSQTIGIPIGTVIGGQLFSGRGPIIRLSVYPVGSVLTSFTSRFEDAGINQTLHKINLRLTSTVFVVIPGGGVTVEVILESPIAESIVVGVVPGTYVNVPKDDMLNLVPIN